MMSRTSLGLIVVLALGLGPTQVRAQSNPTYIQFDPFTAKGVLYRPDTRRAPDVAVLLIHRVNNYLGHLAAVELSRRGFLVLAMNSRFDNNEAAVIWELIALDVKNGMEFLRRQAGVKKVVLFGHSGGGATLSFYQAVAERASISAARQGRSPCAARSSGTFRAPTGSSWLMPHWGIPSAC